jgi:hypothetical protein
VTSVLPYFPNLVINTLKSYKNTVAFSLKIRLLVRPSLLNSSILPACHKKRSLTDRTKKEIDINTKRDQRPAQIVSWRLSIAPINNAQSTYVMTQFVIKNPKPPSLTNDHPPHPWNVVLPRLEPPFLKKNVQTTNVWFGGVVNAIFT